MSARMLIIGMLLGIAFLGTACGGPTIETLEPTRAATPITVPSPSPTQKHGFSVAIDDSSVIEGTIAPEGPLVLLFDETMQAIDADDVIQFSPHVEGIAHWNRSNDQLTFTPQTGFKPGATYTVFLNSGLISLDGDHHTGDGRLSFQVLAAPSVVRHQPDASRLENRSPTIKLEFDRAMDPTSVANALLVRPAVKCDLSWPTASELHIELTESIVVGTRYHFTLETSAEDTRGMRMESPYRWSYWLPDIHVDLTSPQTYGEKDIRITFNYDVDRASVESSLRVEPPLAYAFNWTSKRSVRLLLDDPPQPGIDYTLSFDHPITDRNGDRLGLPEALVYRSPPPILSTSPDPDSYYDPYYDTEDGIRVRFDRAMDRDSVERAFSIKPDLPGYFTWDENELTYHPTMTMERMADYSITLDPPIKDAAGNDVLTHAYTWSFSSGYYNTAASFGLYGAMIQVVDADGLRPIQFSLSYSKPTRIIFELHELSIRQLVALNIEDPHLSHPTLVDVSGGSDMVRTWEITSGLDEEHWNIKQVYLPEDVPPGLYMLGMKIDGVVQDQILVVLSRNTLVAKHAGDDLFAWLTDIHGDVVPDAEIRVYTTEGVKIRESHTDKDGVYETTIPEGHEPLLVIARQGENDIAVAGLSSTWSSTTRYWSSWNSAAAETYAHYTYIYTDRPIYRPGQTVHYKAILRQDDDVVYSLMPVDSPVQVRIRDARGNLVQSTELTTNDFGSIHGSFSLAEGASLGEYCVEVSVEGETFAERFKVQDYRKPDIRVDISTDTPVYVQGDEITVDVEAQYLFGEPVQGAKIEIRFYELGQYYSYYWEEETDDQDDQYVWHRSSRPGRTGKTDADGRFTYTSTAGLGYEHWQTHIWGSSQRLTTWGIEVTLDDGSHQSVSSFSVVQVYDATEIITLTTPGYLHAPGTEFYVEAGVETFANLPVADHALRLEIYKWDRRHYDYDTLIETITPTTGENGVARIPLSLSETGHYKLVLTAEDERKNEMATYRYVGIYDVGYPWTDSSSSGDLTVWAERDRYSPYETANIYIESSFAGPALMTFERGKVHRAQEIVLTPPITRVQVPLLASDVPNIFVSVNAWQPESTTLGEYEYSNKPESRLHQASLELQVDAYDKELKLTLEASQSSYGPGEQAVVTLRVTDHQGEPVRAEVSLALVDEGIYVLSDELADPIMEAFYGPRRHSVKTFDSMAPWREIFSPDRGGGGGGGGEGTPPSNLRSEFEDVAAWIPALRTDANGEAVVTVQLPDNLTTWRLTARAVTTDTLVGEATARIVTQQAVIVRPILPRSLTAGDRMTLTAIVHNYSETSQELDVVLESDGLEINDEDSKTLVVPAGESVAVGWSVVAGGVGEAEIVVTAQGDGVADAIRLSVPVQPLAVPEVTTQVGTIEDEFDTIIFWPEDALDLSNVRIEVSRSIEGNMLSGIEFLTGFPYGCVEQIMSKALPNAVVGRAFHQLGVGDADSLGDLRPKIASGLQKLYAMQHQDGGWGWWFDDRTHDYQTAWVVFGLATTAEAGYEVDEQAIRRGVEWLQENLEDLDPRTKVFALYSMAIAGYGDREASLDLYQDWMMLDTFSQAALAITLDELDAGDAARVLLQALEDDVLRDSSGAYWPSPQGDGYYRRKTMSSTIRSTAMALSAFARLDPENELLPETVRWLMGQRRRHGWGTTNETSFSVLALSDYLLATQQAEGQIFYQIELNDEIIVEGTLEAGSPMHVIEIGESQMESGLNRLRIRNADSGRLYYLASTRLYLPTAEVEAAGSIEVTRVYSDASKKRIEGAAAGDLVKVTLTVEVPADSSYVIVEDRLPGGLEALNEGLNSSSHMVDEYGNERYYWVDLGYNYKEVHGDRVSFFITELEQGRHEFSYYCRVIHEGSFIALPAEAWEMYDLASWGRSASTTFQVLPAEYAQPIESAPDSNDAETDDPPADNFLRP